jgi:hypothetical protein
MQAEAAQGTSPKKRAKRPEADLLSENQPSAPLDTLPVAGPLVGGLLRPWMTHGTQLKSVNLVEDVGVVFWEGGAKTTSDIKKDIIHYLDQVESLVQVVDLKRAEHPDDLGWWPSMRVVQAWIDEDPFFSTAINQYMYAKQQVLLERSIHDLYGTDLPKSKAEAEQVRQRLKFAATVLPRTVNKGLRERVEIDTTNNVHVHGGLSEDALMDRIKEMQKNPRVQAFLTAANLPGAVVEGQVLPPEPPPAPDVPLPFRDLDDLTADLGAG